MSFRSNTQRSSRGRLDTFGTFENMGSLFKGASENMGSLFGDRITRPGSMSAIGSSENMGSVFGERNLRPGSASVLGDRTNFHKSNNANSNSINVSGALSKPAKPTLASGAPLSARPPLQPGDSNRLSNTGSSPEARASVSWTGDEADIGNAQACTEYIEDIFQILRKEENTDQPSPNYMDSQEINPRMRAVLIDWLVEVHMKYKLRPETLFLAITIIDRFLAKKCVSRKRLQLVGVTATLIASKYEEIYPPKLSELVFICDKAYTKEEIVKMEIIVLNVLEFKLRVPTAVQFLDRFAKVSGCAEQQRQLSQYLAELALPEINMIRFTASHLAAASIYLSSKPLKQPVAWPQTMCIQTGYTEAAIKGCANELRTLLENAQTSSLQGVRKKFSHAKYHSVAKIPFSVHNEFTPF